MIVRTMPLAPGPAGERRTLEQMATEVAASHGDPLTAALARRTLPVSVQDRDAMAANLRAFLAGSWQFVPDDLLASEYGLVDPEGDEIEVLHTPHQLAQSIYSDGFARGDCDDAAILAAALAWQLGLPARLVAIGFDGLFGPLTHVYTEVATPAGWWDMDITRPAQGPLPATTRRVDYPL